MAIQVVPFPRDDYHVNPLGYESWVRLAAWFCDNGFIDQAHTTTPPSDAKSGVTQAKRYLTMRKKKGAWTPGYVRGGFVKVVRPGKDDEYYFDVVNQGMRPSEPIAWKEGLPMVVVDSEAIRVPDLKPVADTTTTLNPWSILGPASFAVKEVFFEVVPNPDSVWPTFGETIKPLFEKIAKENGWDA